MVGYYWGILSTMNHNFSTTTILYLNFILPNCLTEIACSKDITGQHPVYSGSFWQGYSCYFFMFPPCLNTLNIMGKSQKTNSMNKILITCILLFALASCSDDDIPPNRIDVNYNFETSAEGWIADFADYPAGREEDYELTFEHTRLPPPLNENIGALMLSGTNLSDDLFMFLKKKIIGLEPVETYSTFFEIEFASNEPDSVPGVGGSPGESVWIKAGATTMQPIAEEDSTGYLRMNIQKGNQSTGGEEMIVLGDFSNDTDLNIYSLKTVINDEPFYVTSDVNGELWLIVGTESGFEANTTIFFNSVRAKFIPVDVD